MQKNELTTIAGRVGKNPVVYFRNTKTGKHSVVKFPFAVNALRNKEREVVWFQVSAWNKVGNVAARNLRKGDAAQLHGFVKPEEFTNKKGERVKVLAFNCIFIDFLGKSRKNSSEREERIENVAAKALSDAPF